VRLIVVTALDGQVGQRPAGGGGPLDPPSGVVESEDPPRLLGREAELRPEQRAEAAGAQPGLRRQFGHADRAAGLPQPPPPVPDLGPDLANPVGLGLRGAPRQQVVERCEPPRPVRLGRDQLAQAGREPADHIRRLRVPVRHGRGGDAEQRPRPQRGEPELHAGPAALVGDQGRGCVQPAEQRVIRLGRLARVRVRGENEPIVERDDERQQRRRQPAMPPGRHPRLPEPGVPRDQRPQRWCRRAPRMLIYHTPLKPIILNVPLLRPPGQRRADGRRPERTVYARTEVGDGEFGRWIDELIRTPAAEYPKFMAAVSYLGALGPHGASDALAERAEHLQRRIGETTAVLADTVGSGQTPRLFMIEVECALHAWEAELTWTGRTIAEIRDGSLVWPQVERADQERKADDEH
jgi:hypothetical protein